MVFQTFLRKANQASEIFLKCENTEALIYLNFVENTS